MIIGILLVLALVGWFLVRPPAGDPSSRASSRDRDDEFDEMFVSDITDRDFDGRVGGYDRW